MSDITEVIDDYCRKKYGHTNWAWGEPMTKDIDSIIIIYAEPNEEEDG